MPIIKEPLQIIDGIRCYTKQIEEDYQDYNAAGLDKLYVAEKNHFWFISRRERILASFSKYLSKKSQVLEIGAGTGYVAQGLKNKGYEVAVGEIHLSGLHHAKANGISTCYQFDLFDPPFEKEFDAIGMFDVLEHLEDDVLAVQQVAKMLKSEGKLFITVPAHQGLWSRIDTIAAHKRRYSKQSLIQTVEDAGLKVIEIKFFFIFILPLLYLRHTLNRDAEQIATDKEIHQKITINPIINKILLWVSRLENKLSKWLPNIAGGSLLLVAIKNSISTPTGRGIAVTPLK